MILSNCLFLCFYAFSKRDLICICLYSCRIMMTILLLLLDFDRHISEFSSSLDLNHLVYLMGEF